MSNTANRTVAINVTLTPEMAKQLNTIKATRSDRTEAELFQQIVERGLYDLSYRTARNQKQYAEFKAWKQSQK